VFLKVLKRLSSLFLRISDRIDDYIYGRNMQERKKKTPMQDSLTRYFTNQWMNLDPVDYKTELKK